MAKPYLFAVFPVLVALSSGLAAAAPAAKAPCFSVWELPLQASRDYANPYTDVQFTASFTGPGGKLMVVDGFWDGGRTWRLRFAPTQPGTWRYVTKSDDPGLDGKRGQLVATPALGHGFVMARSGKPGRFVYSDGTPFYYAGTSLSCFNGLPGVGLYEGYPPGGGVLMRDGTFQKVVDRRAAQGFDVLWTMGDLFGKPDFNDKTQANEGGPPFVDYDPARLNPAFFQWADKRVAYANSRGLAVTMGLGWPDQDIRRFGMDNLKRAWTYVLARYGAYNVLWCIFGEFEEFGGDAVALANEFGRLTAEHDPYRHPASTHSVDSCDELAGEAWLGYIVQQSRDYDLVSQDVPLGKPVVNAEFYYENVTGQEITPAVIPDINPLRRGAWEITARGGRFVYEIWGIERDLDRYLETDGTRQIMYLHRLMRSLPYWKMAPDEKLATPLLALSDAKASGLVWVAQGGLATLNLAGLTSPLRARWYDPRAGVFCRAALLQGERADLTAPDLRDWVLVIDPRPNGYRDDSLPEAPHVSTHLDLAPLKRGRPLVEYDFAEPGSVVRNKGSLGAAADLSLSDLAAVEWLPGGGMRVAKPVVARTPGDLAALVDAAKAAGRLLLEVVFKPENLTQRGPARIVSLSTDPSHRDFTVGQDLAEIEWRLRTSLDLTNENGIPAWNSAVAPLGPEPHAVTVDLYYDGTDRYIWLGGRPFDVAKGVKTGLPGWQPMPLCLANEADGSRPWVGTLYHVAIWAGE